ncbi:MAG: cation diffusion facilitator family transporter [Coriobacteriia bacterium]|nr:cation diffusion facilitator family transporter [Coriobacteriia bacterium]MCL2537075.1 cation diffusion facilitator family transporter [Coriobacteriia bacterium]
MKTPGDTNTSDTGKSDFGHTERLSREVALRGVMRITLFTLISNIFLTAIKGIAGVLAGSAALISDAANSASDVFYGIIVMLGVRIASREADEKHPYGYERFESLVSMFLGAVVTLAGLFIGFDGLQKVWQGATYGIEAPNPAALWVAALVIAFKTFMYLFTRARAKKYRSDILAAAAADHGSDVLATSGVFIGIAAAQVGWPIMDPIASLVIAVLIIRTGISIIHKAVGQVTDQSAGADFDQRVHDIICEHKEVTSVDMIQSRVFGDRIYVDVEISLPCDYTICAAHSIGDEIHNEIEARIPEVKHCMVHINPSEVAEGVHTSKASKARVDGFIKTP